MYSAVWDFFTFMGCVSCKRSELLKLSRESPYYLNLEWLVQYILQLKGLQINTYGHFKITLVVSANYGICSSCVFNI